MHCHLFRFLTILWMMPMVLQGEVDDPSGTRADSRFTPAELKQLQRDKILVSRQEELQSFSVYLDKSMSLFITSDAVLNAYHVLFEATLRQQEKVHAQALQKGLSAMLPSLTKAKELFEGNLEKTAAARAKASFVIGVALNLMGGDISFLAKEMQSAIQEESLQIERADGHHKPRQLGPAEPDFLGFDYTVFRPVGFYAASPKLEQYFRAVRWLQLVPHRLDHDDELLSYLLLADLPFDVQFRWNAYGLQSQNPSEHNFGDAVLKLKKEPLDERWFKETRVIVSAEIKSAAPTTLKNDRLRAIESKSGELRILPPIELPEDDALWQSAAVKGPPPSALEFASWLDFPMANQLLLASATKDRKPLLDAAWPLGQSTRTIKTPGRGWDQSIAGGICWQQVKALRGLWQIDDRAPDFMKQAPWQRKTLQTIAASWAQTRHAWCLQERLNIAMLGVQDDPKIFIEPVPDFFDGLASACSTLARIAEYEEYRGGLLIETREELDYLCTKLTAKSITDAERSQLRETIIKIANLTDQPSLDGVGDDATLESQAKEAVEALHPKDAARYRLLVSRTVFHDRNLSNHWKKFAMVCLRLAVLANKQLCGRDFSASETAWLAEFGSTMAEFILDRFDLHPVPPDDAPRVARLASDPSTGKIWHVGIGRPRILYVLYPWRGQDILCQGSVMPYHETVETTALTDTEWQQRFQGDTRPPVPTWLEDFVPVDGVKSR